MRVLFIYVRTRVTALTWI